MISQGFDDEFYMRAALARAGEALSHCEFPVGCIIVHKGEVIATGERTGTVSGGNEVDHAEMTALRRLSAASAVVDLKDAVLYCTLEPCLMCYSAIILSGIGRVVYAYEDAMGGGTGMDLSGGAPIYRDASVEVVPGVLRGESLALFRAFFLNPENIYWKDSYLETYTLIASSVVPSGLAGH